MSRNIVQPIFKHSLIACALFTLLSPTAFSEEVKKANNSETIEELENFSPETSAIDLSKVVVTAGGFSQEVKSAPASISVVTQQDMQEAPFRDISEALKDIPGVNVSGKGTSADIAIRGMGPQYTLFMVDGKRQGSRQARPNGSEGFEQGWMPPLSAIERIEVVRGPMSSRYGSDAMGGVINVITKKVSDEWGGSLRLETTLEDESHTGNTQTAEFYLNGPLIKEMLGLQLFGKYSHQDEGKYTYNSANSVLGGSSERKLHNLVGKLTFVPVKGQTFELEAGTTTQRDEKTVGKSIEPSARAVNADDTHRRIHQSIRYLGEYDNGVTSDFVISNEKTDNKFRKINIKNLDINGNLIIPIDTHTVTIGGQHRIEKLDATDNRVAGGPSKLEHKTFAFFMEDEWWMLDNFAITGGLRYDHDDKYGSNFTPRIYGVWNIDEAWTLKGGISSGYAAPSLRQTSEVWGQQTGGRANQGNPRKRGMIHGNPDLKPEKTLNYEIGLNFSPDETLDTTATIFYTEFKDKIQIVDIKPLIKDHEQPYIGPDGFEYGFIQGYVNADRAKSKGLELSARWKPIEDITLSGNYTWIRTEITKGKYKGAGFTQTPKHMLNIQADWQFMPQAHVWTKMNYRGKEISLNRDGGPGDRYPGYTTFDLGGSYKLDKNTNFYAGIYNIGNKKIRNTDLDHTIDGRRYWIGVNIDF